MKSANDIIDLLKKNGFRITAARRALVDLFTTLHKPVSALEVRKALEKKGLVINQVTVYRELSFLTEQNIVHPVQFHDGVQRYESSSLPHHHHLVCLTCNDVDDVHMESDMASVERGIEKEKSFKILRHSLEFYGECAKCIDKK